jgi:hypothetical protein
VIWPEHHRRDEDRVLAEAWPFAWTVPAPHYRGAAGAAPGTPHPQSTMVARYARQLREKIERRRAYAAQASLYAQAAGRVIRDGAHPDLIIVDEITRGPGTELHRLVEEFESGQAPAGSAAGRRRNGGA